MDGLGKPRERLVPVGVRSQRSRLKGAVRGGYGAKAAGRLSVFAHDSENNAVNTETAA
jgi:hypothetical protein